MNILNEYLNHPMHHNMDMKLEFKGGNATLSCAVTPSIINLVGIVHGAIYFKLMDDACFFAALSLNKSKFVATSDFNIHYLKPISEGRITAKASVIQKRKRFYLCEAKIFDDEDQLCSYGSGKFVEPKTQYSYKKYSER